jgi:hypothetical protein
MANEKGGQFLSRQAAIDDANTKFRSMFGEDIKFPDGDEGSLVDNDLNAAWSFRVVNPLGKALGHYDVRCMSKELFWLGISCTVKL